MHHMLCNTAVGKVKARRVGVNPADPSLSDSSLRCGAGRLCDFFGEHQDSASCTFENQTSTPTVLVARFVWFDEKPGSKRRQHLLTTRRRRLRIVICDTRCDPPYGSGMDHRCTGLPFSPSYYHRDLRRVFPPGVSCTLWRQLQYKQWTRRSV